MRTPLALAALGVALILSVIPQTGMAQRRRGRRQPTQSTTATTAPTVPSGIVLPAMTVPPSASPEGELIVATPPDGAVAPFAAPSQLVPTASIGPRLQLIASYDGAPTTVQVRVNAGMGILRNYDDPAPTVSAPEIAVDCVVEAPAPRPTVSVVLAVLRVTGRSTR